MGNNNDKLLNIDVKTYRIDTRNQACAVPVSCVLYKYLCRKTHARTYTGIIRQERGEIQAMRDYRGFGGQMQSAEMCLSTAAVIAKDETRQ